MIQLDSKMSILVISNHDGENLRVQAICKKLGFSKVLSIADGLEALNICIETPPDLLLCSSNVDFSSGWKLIQEIKLHKDTKNFPILFFSSEESKVTNEAFEEFGVLPPLKFPFNEKDFMGHASRSISTYRDKRSIEFAYTEAKNKMADGMADEAVHDFEKIRAKRDNDMRSSIGLAQAYEQCEEYEKSEYVISEARMQGEVPVAKLAIRIKVKLVAGKFDQAMEILEDSQIENNDNPIYFSTLVSTIRPFKNEEMTLSHCNCAIKSGFEDYTYYIEPLKFKINGPNSDDILKDIARLRKRFGDTVESLNLEAVFFRKNMKPDKAIERYKSAILLRPNDPRLYFNLGLCESTSDLLEDARISFSKCLELDPNFKKAQDKLKGLETAA